MPDRHATAGRSRKITALAAASRSSSTPSFIPSITHRSRATSSRCRCRHCSGVDSMRAPSTSRQYWSSMWITGSSSSSPSRRERVVLPDPPQPITAIRSIARTYVAHRTRARSERGAYRDLAGVYSRRGGSNGFDCDAWASAREILRALLGEFSFQQPRRLADFDHVAVGVAHVAADLGAAIDRRRDELGPLLAPPL